VESFQVLAESLRGVPGRIHRDEEELNPLALLFHLPKSLAQMREGEGAYVGAGSVAEKDHQNLARKVGRADLLTLMGHEAEARRRNGIRKEISRGVRPRTGAARPEKPKDQSKAEEDPGENLEDASRKMLVHKVKLEDHPLSVHGGGLSVHGDAG